jgi:CubicO group peptidase (beta-lactamase class C family)
MSLIPNKVERIRQWFDENFASREELGASVSIWEDGSEILHLSAGYRDRERLVPWTQDTLVPVWSATKGPAAVACLLALEEAGVTLEQRVTSVWPEFGHAGKNQVTLKQLLSHRAGLCALDERAPIQNHAAVIHALERQTPNWPPGESQGYHARTFGFLLDEIVRRLTGAACLGQYFRDRIGEPLGLDFWIGLPEAEWPRVSPVYPGKLRARPDAQEFLTAFARPETLTHRAFASPAGLNAVSDFNRPDTWALGLASMGGVGSAHGLGKFYALLAKEGMWDGREIVPKSMVRQLSQVLSQQEDAVLRTPIAFSAGLMKDPVTADGAKIRSHFGPSHGAFGHPGAGGSLAFADPENRLAFAYVMNQMEIGALPGPRALGLVERLYA